MKVFVRYAAVDHANALARATSGSDPAHLRQLRSRQEAADEHLRTWANGAGAGGVVSSGDGEGLLEVPASKLGELDDLRSLYGRHLSSACAMGVGTKMPHADLALRVAIKRGGDRVMLYRPELHSEVAEEKQREAADPLSRIIEHEQAAERGAAMEKAEAPAMNTGPGAGFQGGGHMAVGTPATPTEGTSDHSEGQVAQDEVADQRDLEEQFHTHAQQQLSNDQQTQATQAQNVDGIKAQVAQVLEQLRGQAPVLAQIKQKAPQTFQAVTALIQSVVAMGRALSPPQPMQKMEQRKDSPEGAAAAHRGDPNFLREGSRATLNFVSHDDMNYRHHVEKRPATVIQVHQRPKNGVHKVRVRDETTGEVRDFKRLSTEHALPVDGFVRGNVYWGQCGVTEQDRAAAAAVGQTLARYDENDPWASTGTVGFLTHDGWPEEGLTKAESEEHPGLPPHMRWYTEPLLRGMPMQDSAFTERQSGAEGSLQPGQHTTIRHWQDSDDEHLPGHNPGYWRDAPGVITHVTEDHEHPEGRAFHIRVQDGETGEHREFVRVPYAHPQHVSDPDYPDSPKSWRSDIGNLKPSHHFWMQVHGDPEYRRDYSPQHRTPVDPETLRRPVRRMDDPAQRPIGDDGRGTAHRPVSGMEAVMGYDKHQKDMRFHYIDNKVVLHHRPHVPADNAVGDANETRKSILEREFEDIESFAKSGDDIVREHLAEVARHEGREGSIEPGQRVTIQDRQPTFDLHAHDNVNGALVSPTGHQFVDRIRAEDHETEDQAVLRIAQRWHQHLKDNGVVAQNVVWPTGNAQRDHELHPAAIQDHLGRSMSWDYTRNADGDDLMSEESRAGTIEEVHADPEHPEGRVHMVRVRDERSGQLRDFARVAGRYGHWRQVRPWYDNANKQVDPEHLRSRVRLLDRTLEPEVHGVKFDEMAATMSVQHGRTTPGSHITPEQARETWTQQAAVHDADPEKFLQMNDHYKQFQFTPSRLVHKPHTPKNDEVGDDPMRKDSLHPNKTGRHTLQLPVGSAVEGGPHTTAKPGEVGKLKVKHGTGDESWKQMRAGMVTATADTHAPPTTGTVNHPTSSRNPKGR